MGECDLSAQRRWQLRSRPTLVLMIRRGVVCAVLAVVLSGCAQPSPAGPPAPAPPSAATSSTQPALPAPTTTTTTTTTTYTGPDLIDHVRWTANSKGRALHVYPTEAGRTANGAPARATAWQEVVRASPQADTPSLHDQFNCHWDFARIIDPRKTSWDLEAWRPDVGYGAVVAAQCNPGGAE